MGKPTSPQEILALARNFMECRVLLTGAELNLFSHLTDPVSSRDLAESQNWHERPLAVLLDALAAMGLVVKERGRYRTEPGLLPFLRPDSPKTVLPMVRHAATIWNNWSQLTQIVTETGGVEKPAGIFENPEDRKAFIGAMHVVARKRAPQLAGAIDVGSARRLLDVGGASGTYTIAFLKASPDMSATLFDLPEVVALARERIEAAGLADRVELVGGDFQTDSLPSGHDLALLSAIIHMNSPEENVALYKKIFDALVPGGRIIIRDHVMQPDRTEPTSGAIFAVNMLVGTPGGGTYTLEDIRTGLTSAGFANVQLLQEDDPMMGLVQAVRP
jgi:predicted O-methyltransferase YrrM